MNRHLTSRAIARARWAAELATALDEAERVLAHLIAEGVSPFDTERLRLRLIAIGKELPQLNRVSLTDDRIVGSAWPSELGAP